MQLLERENIFSGFLQNESIFSDKHALSSSFIPGTIIHRDREINQMSSILAPALRGYAPSNVFAYGTCGTGKTICTQFILSQLNDVAKKTKKKTKAIYVNCKMKKVADTEYRLFAHLLKIFGENVPDTGLPTDTLYRRFFSVIEQHSGIVIIALDEIDSLVRKVGDDFLYNFTRINTELKNSHIATIGITNDLSFRDGLDLRVKSSLSEEEVLFKPYNALQLKDILEERSRVGFNQNAVSEIVLAKCAALAAQEHGDARRALDLLRVSGETAERMGENEVTEEHIDIALQKIDLDRVTETIQNQPRQSQAVLYSIIKLHEKLSSEKQWKDKRMLTGDVYDTYTKMCANNNITALTQRRVSDLIGELDMLGIITAKVVSKGRYGRTREISVAINNSVLDRVHRYLTSRFS